MLPKTTQTAKLFTGQDFAKYSHILVVLPAGKSLPVVPQSDCLQAALKRRRMKIAELAESPVTTECAGGLVAWVALDSTKSRFEQLTAIRKASQLLLAEHPNTLAIAVFGDAAQRKRAAETALYVAWLNGVQLPVRKKKTEAPLQKIALSGCAEEFPLLRAQAGGNALTRELTMLPANELTPALYRVRVKKLAREQGWKHEEFDLKALRKMGAGAFVAVAQGSSDEDAAIVHLSYRPRGAKKTIALVGKGICFDTGGHNLKPAKYMHGMHEDMNGSAVALGILLAATQAKLPVNIDCWLALAQNHISPKAYKQNDVVTALNGTTIEIIHTDAEGRMVLADTLALAAKGKPDVMFDFATLTGSMAVALGARYSGVLSNQEKLLEQAVTVGKQTGERVCAFPLDADYEPALDSKIADIKQCTMDGDADHILAARFLKRFVGDTPWLHMDLSASSCEGGLGAVGSNVTGFGVAWGVAMLGKM